MTTTTMAAKATGARGAVSREMLLRLIAGLALAALLGWIVSRTEWVEIDAPNPPRGAAATDPLHPLQVLVEAGGGTLVRRDNLDLLPPASATLWLDSRFWALFPEREAALRRWVEQGGHLVLTGRMLQDEHLRPWIALRDRPPPAGAQAAAAAAARLRAASAASGASAAAPPFDDPEDDEDEAPATARPPGFPAPPRAAPSTCRWIAEPDGVPLAFPPRPAYHVCLTSWRHLQPVGVAPLWGLGEADDFFALRVPVGRGSVSAWPGWSLPDAKELATEDHALILAAAFGLRAGQPFWVVNDEGRPPLRAWLWQQARTPLLLAAAALALGLWRGAVRFGPRVAPPRPLRRSMAEQVRGTGEFIGSTDPAALHRAACRAFDETCRAQMPGYDALSLAERAAAVAQRVTIDPQRLLAALQAPARGAPGHGLAAIALLEAARRALRRRAAAGPGSA